MWDDREDGQHALLAVKAGMEQRWNTECCDQRKDNNRNQDTAENESSAEVENHRKNKIWPH